MRSFLVSIASSCLVLQVLGSTGAKDSFKNQFGSCKQVKSGINMAKYDGSAPINVPCRDNYRSEAPKICDGTCCARKDACTGDKRISTDKTHYEGGCSPNSLVSNHSDYDPNCKQVGECHPAYMYATRGSFSLEGTMMKLPKATLDRLMAGSNSNWCSQTQRCQDEPCPGGFETGGAQSKDEASYSSPLGVSLGFMSLMVTFWG